MVTPQSIQTTSSSPGLLAASSSSSRRNNNGNRSHNEEDETLAAEGASIEDNNNNDNNRRRKRISNIPSLCCAFLASLTTGGTTYAFGLYGNALKRTLHLSQSQLDTISTANFCAGLFSWIPGLIVDTFGTRFSLAAGGIIGALSLVAYWAVARQFVYIESKVSVVVTLCILGISIFLSSALVTGSVFKIIVGTCGPGTKGSAVGVAKGYVGLGAGAYACLFQTIRTKSESDLDFLPMAAFFCIFVVTMPALFLLPNNDDFKSRKLHDESTPAHFRCLFCSLIAMAIFIVVSSMLELMDSDTVPAPSSANKTTANLQNYEVVSKIHEEQHELEQSIVDQALLNSGELSQGPETYTFSQYARATFLVTIWIAPIYALLLLPRRKFAPPLPGQEEDYMECNDDECSEVEMTVEHLMDDNSDHDSTHSSGASRRSVGTSEKNDSPDMDAEENLFLLSSDSDAAGNAPSVSAAAGAAGAGAGAGAGTGGRTVILTTRTSPMSGNANSVDGTSTTRNYNLAEMLQTPSALLLLWTTTILAGGGTVETNNIGQMVESLGLPHVTASASLAIFSVAQAAARVATGAISESALNWRTKSCFMESGGIPRPFFLVIASIAAFLAHGLLAVAVEKYTFVVGSALAGFAFGMIWPLMVLIVGEVFGTANVGANYMFYDGFTSAVGTLILSKMVAQQVYEDHITVMATHYQTSSPIASDLNVTFDENAITVSGAEGPISMDVSSQTDQHAHDNFTCLGKGCFQMTHVTVALLSLTCIVTSWRMMYTSRDVYNKPSRHAV